MRRAPAVGQGSVHLGLWRLADASRRWALSSPYDPKLVDAIKTIPGRARAWLPTVKVWMVEREYADTLRGFLGRLYYEDAFCPACWTGDICPALAELAGAAGATMLTSRPPPAPSPPWPEKIPETRAEAAAVLGVQLGSDLATIKKAHRALAFAAHPDKVGEASTHRMKVLNAARALLE